MQALEVASGTGVHVAALAAAFPRLRWQPTDCTDGVFDSLAAQAAGCANVLPPRLLDASAPPEEWQLPCASVRAVVAVNVAHITPWTVTLGLLAGAAAVLEDGGLLFLYGPFFRDGVATTESNAAFDASLRGQNAEWGYRDIAAVVEAAACVGLTVLEILDMPANNFMLVLTRRPRPAQ